MIRRRGTLFVVSAPSGAGKTTLCREVRLRERRSDAEVEIERRLGRAREEIALWRRYDYLIVNRDVKEALVELESIIMAERCRVKRIDLTLPDLEVPN